jgi:undecaprenyl-diphosphatase
MKYALYVLGLLPVIIFIWFSQNLESSAVLSFDEYFAELLFGNSFIQLFHYIGDTIFVMIVTAILIIYFAWRHKNYRASVFILLTIAGGTIVNQFFKHYFERPRPEIANQLDSFSFPSGHSMLGILYLLTIAYLFGKLAMKKSIKIWLWTICTLLFVLIGMSRVAEARHYASDVISGWSLGLFWLTICIVWYELKSKQSNKKTAFK